MVTTTDVPCIKNEQTWVDKRGKSRQIPMRLICPSLSRSGSSSLRVALWDLGYEAYHGWSLCENPPDCILWQEAMKAKFEKIGRLFTKEDFDAILFDCDAIIDVPGSLFVDELIDAYPEAKVVMTIREVDDWHASCLATIVPYFKLSPLAVILGYLDRAFGLYLPTFNLVMKYTYGDEFAANGKKIYRNHYVRVRQKMLDTHLGANYLEFNVKEGWEPLCKFLGRPVPTDAEGKPKLFPRVNDRTVFGEIFDERLETLTQRMIWMGVACLVPIVAILGGSWWKGFKQAN